VKIPHFSIAGLMAIVAFVAVDFAVFRACNDSRFVQGAMAKLVVIGMLPMANVLAFGLLPFLTRPGPIGGRPFLVRFEVSGVTALLLFGAVCSIRADDMLEGIRDGVKLLGIWPAPLIIVAVVTLMLVPQLAFAWFVAWLIGLDEARDPPSATKLHPGRPDDLP
jgi:hypothetical protein